MIPTYEKNKAKNKMNEYKHANKNEKKREKFVESTESVKEPA